MNEDQAKKLFEDDMAAAAETCPFHDEDLALFFQGLIDRFNGAAKEAK